MNQIQTDKTLLDRIALLFRQRMDELGIVPKNPWKCRNTRAWLEKMGCRMIPCHGPGRAWPLPDWKNYVHFYLRCEKSSIRIKGSRQCWMRIEVPKSLADKILVLDFLPGQNEDEMV